ncbi:MAG TPA: amidohydrolase family protein, partial [Stellaceae bacterium]|nr:amidohydrolase family protein [Stellaceae bacterium]
MIDGTGAGPVTDAAIVIHDRRIEAVGTPSGWPDNTPFHDNTEFIDISGMTVLPGLIDCHDHLAMHGYDLARRWGIDEPQTTRTLRTARVLRETLRMGYTTVRDAAGLDAGFKRAIEEGLIEGPRLVVSLVIISPIGGIGDRVSPSGFSCCVPNDPLLPDGVVTGLGDVRAVVRRVVRAGADVIKCATTGGASSRPEHGPKDGAFNFDEMQALVEEAHALDRRVICHALGGRGLRIAVEAGADSIDHGCYLDEEPELLDQMARQGTFFVPTFAVYDYHRKSPLPHIRERAKALEEHHAASLRKALSAGVKIATGTDAGGHGHPMNALEIACLVRAGMAPLQA